MRSWVRAIVWLAVGGAALALLVYAFIPPPVSVDIARIERGPMQVTVDEDGKTRVRERYVVSAPLGGQLLRIDLDEGDRVEAGKTLLASIAPHAPSLLDPRAASEAEARVQAAQAAVDQADARLKAAEAALNLATRHLERARPLHTKGVVSQEELDERIHQQRIAAENVRAAQFARQTAEYEVKLAQAALIRTRDSSEGTGERFKIHSPVDGHVLRVIQESATVVTPGTQLLEVGDPRELEVEVDVLSADAARIKEGARVILERWGGDHPLEGRVRLIEPSGFMKISALGVEEQRVNVIIDLLDPPEKRASLGDAYRVETRIVVWEKDSALLVPAGALFRDGEAWAVYVVRDGKAALQHVEIGQNNGMVAEVISGLEEGETVILHPSDKVSSGTAVVPRGT